MFNKWFQMHAYQSYSSDNNYFWNHTFQSFVLQALVSPIFFLPRAVLFMRPTVSWLWIKNWDTSLPLLCLCLPRPLLFHHLFSLNFIPSYILLATEVYWLLMQVRKINNVDVSIGILIHPLWGSKQFPVKLLPFHNFV